jgi:hypothetical protein
LGSQSLNLRQQHEVGSHALLARWRGGLHRDTLTADQACLSGD